MQIKLLSNLFNRNDLETARSGLHQIMFLKVRIFLDPTSTSGIPVVLTSVNKVKGDLQTICRLSYLKVHKLSTLGTKFKNL